ncbi:hypothetical protein ERE_34770 [Agathobacter rectalis M104/1]|uniref:immunoglobulin-like domain-containing protein n=1 Tax=Agathobacter rectalis TaxID=39491 RepID=UPI0001CD0F8B|nr:immunoglobulin-like domain-containing protein [Agathobacter rectalis]CBK95219.1 hypothetical protein ERE_34770 [Agathobacter rectalis M104/1]
MKKRTAAAFIAAMTITTLTACGGPKQLSKSVTVELGKKDGIKVTDILDVSKDKAKDVKVDTKKVNFYKEGKYDATLTYDKKEYKITVKIKDTVAPEATAKESITVQTGTAVHVTDCLAKVTEASGNIKAEFETKPEANNAQGTETTESTETAESTEAQAISVGDVNLSSNDEITYVTAGDYDNNIVVTDDAGNETKVPVKISVINAPTINGVTDKTITVGDTIDYMAGVTATDGKGADITSSVQVDSSAVNTGAVGTYQAAYTVVDDNGLHNSAVSNITVNAPAEKSSDNSGDTDNGNAGTSDNKSNKGSSRKNKSSKKNSSSGSSSSAGSSSGSQSSSNGGGSAASQPANPKAGVAETLYDGSVAHGITAEEKSHIDGIVQKWLSGGCSGADAENEAGNYLISRGYSISSSDSCKDALIVVPNGANYTLNGKAYGLYYYGKLYTTGEMNGDDRIAYITNFSISQ